MTLQWGNPESLGDLAMLPMDDPTWEAILALPEDTEVAAVFLAPFSIGMRVLHFRMDTVNRAKITDMSADGRTTLPAYCMYVLPQVEVPDIDAFLTESRKDADTNE